MIDDPTAALPAFESFDSIPRLKRGCVISEKIDGTNAQICITEAGSILAGSRSRWITPADDNYGFARWVDEHRDGLLALGPGRHFGEWWGAGIQRRYGLAAKRFSLFNAGRWTAETPPPECCSVVPVLYDGPFSSEAVEATLEELRRNGSAAAPGFMKPEGVVVYLPAARRLFKVTLDGDGHKGEARRIP
jgi:hypothetical protein